jgi:hypothetical protein
MISFFLLSLPVFAVIGVGWAATRTRLVAQGALDARTWLSVGNCWLCTRNNLAVD